MNRVARTAPGLFVVGALLTPFLGRAHLLDPPVLQLIVVVAVALAIGVGKFVHRMPTPFLLAVAVAGAGVATLNTADDVDPFTTPDVLADVVSICVSLCLAIVLAIALRSRRGGLDGRDLNDLITVIVGSSLATWIGVTSRMIEIEGVHPVSAISSTLFLPLAGLLFWFIVDLLFTGLRSNQAMQLVAASALYNLIAAVAAGLSNAGVLDLGRQTEVGLYASALLFLCAGLSHRAASATIAPEHSDGESIAYTPLRLTLNGSCLLVPGILVAAVMPLSDADTVVRVVAVILGVSSVMVRLVIAVRDHEVARRALTRRLDLDELTGLPTRSRFVAVVDDVLEATWRSEFEPTIIQLNLDRFKNINDSLGHYEANEVLAAVGERLRDATSRFGGTVARIGGDDFAIVDSTTRSAAEARQRVDHIHDAFADHVQVGDSAVFVTASIGVAVAPRNRTLSAEELLRRADIATHRAKVLGRGSVAVFDDSMQAHLSHRMDVEHALHGAIGRGEMRLYHQPIVNVATGEVSGFESLIRWQRDGTIVSPGEFIPIAEETGIIRELGQWALHEALGELRGWIDDGVIAPTTTISVNVSPRQLADPSFPETVRGALDATGIPANLLWLEMTESVMLEEPELAQTTLQQVRDTGVRIALDDFGTGYSSLSLLQQFPIQRIKIDRAFVDGIAEPGNDRSLVRTVIAMAQSMGLDLVAEGVETVQQLQVLAQLNCNKAQGFLISHPVPADAMRSTMVALDELASLSLFTTRPTELDELDVGLEVGASARVPAIVGAAASASEQLSLSATSRPLGQPVL